MVQLIEKIRDCSGVGFHSWYESSLGYPIRKPNNSVKIEEKVVEIKIKQPKLMPEEKIKKLLFFLPANSKWARIIRRGIIIFVLAGFSGIGVEIAQNSGNYIPEIWIPLITGILAAIDKSLREFATKEKEA